MSNTTKSKEPAVEDTSVKNEAPKVTYVLPEDSPKPQLVMMTPERAEELLKLNVKNRRVRQPAVRDIAEDILAGKWQVTGEPIQYNSELLLNGQHRLLGVIKADTAVPMFVIPNSKSEIFDVIDTGKARNSADVLKMLGFSNTNQLSATLILVDRYEIGALTKTKRYPLHQIKALIAKYSDLPLYLKATHYKDLKGLTTPSVINALEYLFSKRDPLLADRFMEAVASGVGLEKDEPANILRRVLIRYGLNQHSAVNNEHIMALYVKAWNAERTNTKISKLSWKTNENFPEIV